jgi:hypothetical protein
MINLGLELDGLDCPRRKSSEDSHKVTENQGHERQYCSRASGAYNATQVKEPLF